MTSPMLCNSLCWMELTSNLAERGGFAQGHLAQVLMNTTLSDNIQCLCGVQALS
jgi:hypothetical protein